MPYVKTGYAYQRIRDEIFEQERNVHAVSYPVLRKSDDGYDLAVFVDHYTADELTKNEIGRPDMWALADLATGAVKKLIRCADDDFAADVADQTVVAAREDAETDQNYFQKMFHKLDCLREAILSGKPLDKDAYAAYFDLILEDVTPSLADFYRALSKI